MEPNNKITISSQTYPNSGLVMRHLYNEYARIAITRFQYSGSQSTLASRKAKENTREYKQRIPDCKNVYYDNGYFMPTRSNLPLNCTASFPQTGKVFV